MNLITDTYPKACAYLKHIFNTINKEYFGGFLPNVTVTVQSNSKRLGYFVLKENVWETPTGWTFEINISAEHIGDPIVEVAGTLLHEMVHLYNFVNGVKDCTKNGNYHNSYFKKTAEAHGLIAKYDSTKGWAFTYPSDEFSQFIAQCKFEDIKIKRNLISKATKSASSTRKYICPCCGNSVRATKSVRIMCMDCDEVMLLS